MLYKHKIKHILLPLGSNNVSGLGLITEIGNIIEKVKITQIHLQYLGLNENQKAFNLLYKLPRDWCKFACENASIHNKNDKMSLCLFISK